MEEFIRYISYFNQTFNFLLALISLLVASRFFKYRYKHSFLSIFNKKFFYAPFLLTRISFGLRHNTQVNMRMFIEFVIFELKGKSFTRSELKKLYLEFLDNYIKRSQRLYKIKSSFEAESIFEADAFVRYFTYFKQRNHKRIFDIDENKPLKMIVKLEIENGYIVPITSIPGLQDHYNNDWSGILNKFITSCKDNNNQHELFMFYTWLMWGPSYSINYKRNQFKMVQYGIGDESKSLNVVLTDDDASMKLWDDITKSIDEEHYGLFCSVVFEIYDLNAYINEYYDMFNNETQPFVNRLEKTNINYLLVQSDYHLPIAANEKHSFFSAYIWALFVRSESDLNDRYRFDISNCVAFFEHANLSHKQNYTFLTNSLIYKIITHFKEMSSSCTSTYHLTATFNDSISQKIKEEIRYVIEHEPAFSEWFKYHIVLDGFVTTGTLLDRLDEHFSLKDIPLDIHPVSLDDKMSLRLLSQFYVDVYLDNFPDPNERETLDNFLMYLQNDASGKNGKNHYHILIATLNDEIVGGIIGDYFHEINSGVFEFLVINEKLRRKRAGSRLIEEMENIFNIDARKHGYKNVDYIFIETEHPNKVEEALKPMALETVNFWHKQKFSAIDFNYLQPSIDTGKKEVSHLILGVKSCQKHNNHNYIPSNIVNSFVHNYAKYAMSIDHPEQHETVQKMHAYLNEDVLVLKPFKQTL